MSFKGDKIQSQWFSMGGRGPRKGKVKKWSPTLRGRYDYRGRIRQGEKRERFPLESDPDRQRYDIREAKLVFHYIFMLRMNDELLRAT